MALLEKEPRNRPGYAEDVASTLIELGAKDWDCFPQGAPYRYVYRPTLVGRDDWRARFGEMFRACQAGKGSRLFIAGEPGAGKTRLAAEATIMAQRTGFQVIAVQGATIGSIERESERENGTGVSR
jgi:hypothetical protein